MSLLRETSPCSGTEGIKLLSCVEKVGLSFLTFLISFTKYTDASQPKLQNNTAQIYGN